MLKRVQNWVFAGTAIISIISLLSLFFELQSVLLKYTLFFFLISGFVCIFYGIKILKNIEQKEDETSVSIDLAVTHDEQVKRYFSLLKNILPLWKNQTTLANYQGTNGCRLLFYHHTFY
ncbi:hypothetical protein [Aliikangiella sp. IMCC44359]|uniref:hypothetical protein n=1 Tax=Aliikangiella sp. IMCC44359 TaxID=3459125 RepID=UPI00403AB1E2